MGNEDEEEDLDKETVGRKVEEILMSWNIMTFIETFMSWNIWTFIETLMSWNI